MSHVRLTAVFFVALVGLTSVVAQADDPPADPAATPPPPAEPPQAPTVTPAEAVAAEPAVAPQYVPRPPAEPEPSPAPADDPAAWARHIKLGAGAYFWHYRPFIEGVKSFTELYAAWLLVDGTHGNYGFHFEPRFRDTKLRSFFNSNIWVQELYAHWTHPEAKFKVGKVYARFGRPWDGSFYGNLAYFDGLKLEPNLGFSLEGLHKMDEKLSVDYSIQYFPMDGRTNGSLTGRDTLSTTPTAKKRNMVVGRALVAYAPSAPLKLSIGASGQYFLADFADPMSTNDRVFRWNGEAEIAYDGLAVYGEFSRQTGESVVAYPSTGMVSGANNYIAGGVQYTRGRISGRYNLGYVDYSDVDVSEILHQPGVTVTVIDQVALLVEYVYWQQKTSSGKATFDNSLNVVIAISM